MRVEIRWCSGCGTQTAFEQPPCEDGHGEGCLDLACLECGLGIVLRDVSAAEAVREDVRAA